MKHQKTIKKILHLKTYLYICYICKNYRLNEYKNSVL